MIMDFSKDNSVVAKHPIVHYFGSKVKAIRSLKPYFPPFNRIDQYYIDPFMGSLILPFNLNPRSVILNDINNDLYNFWQCVKNNAEELAKELEYVWVGENWYYEYQKRTDPIGKAVYFYIQHLTSHGYDDTSNKTFRHFHTIRYFTKDFTAWKQWFDTRSSFTLWNMDFRKMFQLIARYNLREYYVIYCDPPYFKQGINYNASFSEQDHIDLSNILHSLKDKPNIHIFLSYDDLEFIRNLYKDFYITSIAFNVGSGKIRGEKDYQELLISNKPFKQYFQQSYKTQLDFSYLCKKNES